MDENNEVTDNVLPDVIATDIFIEDPLFIAIKNKDTYRVSRVLAEMPEKVNQVNSHTSGNTQQPPLHAAIKNNDVPMCVLLKEHGASFGAVTECDSNTALHVATAVGVNLDTFKFILGEAEMYIDTKNDEVDTPLHIALEAIDFYDETVTVKSLPLCQLQKARVLLEAGANVNIRNSFDDTPLMLLAGVDEIIDLEPAETAVELSWLLKFMLERGADLTVWNVRGNSVLHQAAGNLNPDVLATIMEDPKSSAFDINARDAFYCTALEKALNFPCTKEGVNIKKVKLLLSQGARFDSWSLKQDECVFTKSIRAFPVKEMTDLLEQNPGNVQIDSTSFKGRTCLHDLVMIETQYFTERVALLVKHGANVNIPDVNGCTPLQLLCNHHPKESKMLEILIESGANLTAVDNFGRMPLHYAAMKEIYQVNLDNERSLHVVERLMKSGAPLNARDVNGCTPLILAAKEGRQKLVEVLLEAGADASAKDGHGKTYDEYLNEHKPIAFPYEFRGILGESFDDDVEDEWDVEEWRRRFWDSFPEESLIPRIYIPEDHLHLWVERAREIRGDPDRFIQQLLQTPNLGQIIDHDLVSSKIDCLVRRIANKIEEIDHRFSADVQLSGSNFEGTKTMAPDEFDYLFRLNRFVDVFEVSQLHEEQKSHAFVKLKEGTETTMFSDLIYRNRRDLIGLRALNRFSYLLRMAICDSSVFAGLDLYFVDENSSIALIPNLEVMYVGGESKDNTDLKISLDIVPCFLAKVPEGWKASPVDVRDDLLRFKNELATMGCLVIPKNKSGVDVQHVSVHMKESSMIRSLQQSWKLAYIACKLLINLQFCPNFSVSQPDVDSGAEEETMIIADSETSQCVTSYMMKTALLHLRLECSDQDPNEDSSDGKNEERTIRRLVWRTFDWIERKTNDRNLTSLGRPWEDLLRKDDEGYLDVPSVLAVCQYIKRLVED